MKRILISAVAGLALVTGALAGNVPFVPAPWDPSNALGTVNSWILNQLNINSYGLDALLGTAVTTSGTTAFTFMADTLTAGTVPVNSVFHVHAAGSNSADANAKTLTLNYGAASCALTVTASAAVWKADFYISQTAAAAQITECEGTQGTTVLAPVLSTGTVSNAAAIAVTLTGTAAVSGTMTLSSAYMETMH